MVKLFTLRSTTLARDRNRNLRLFCRHCNKLFKEGDEVVSTKGGAISHRYCIPCAELLNIIEPRPKKHKWLQTASSLFHCKHRKSRVPRDYCQFVCTLPVNCDRRKRLK